ncbi:MAG: FAD-dependent oxidoreductase [Hydrogenoanaerobacterium sp.]
MNAKQKVVIVGGVAGGASAAARLRRLNEQAEIVLLERDEYISFANCGLPYYIGGEIADKASLLLQTPQSFNARFNVDVRVLSEVSSVNTAAKTVTVHDKKTGKSYDESYDKLLLATGAEPIVPPVPGLTSKKVFTVRNVADSVSIKDFIAHSGAKTVAVIGGGFVGVEVAEGLHASGLSVTLIEMAEQILSPIDYDMICSVHSHMRQKGVKLLLQTELKEVCETETGLSLTLTGKEAPEQPICCDMLVLGIGVKPETSLAKAAGLALTARGHIVTSPSMQTSNKDIYAVGDAVEVTDFMTGGKTAVPLAGPANKQGRVAADNIAEIKDASVYTGTQGSSIIKVFDLTVASTGFNEKTAKRLGLNYDKSFTDSASHASYYPGASSISVKTIFEKGTGKILGAQLVGREGVDKRCDVFATAIRFGATAYDLTRLELCYAPPYSSAKDPVNMAGYVIENLLTGKCKSFHWHEVAALPRDGSVTLLDNRTAAEYERGHIDGFINIPLDSLRTRLNELDKTKPVYITCQVGLRGYVGTRILMQNGFDVYNLSGGYKLYSTIFSLK